VKLFVAAYPPAAAREHLAGTVAGLHLATRPAAGRSTGLIPGERWHLTVAFLGEVPDERRPDVEDALRGAVSGHPAALRLRLAGGGRFGRGRSTILWVGVHGEMSALQKLTRSVGGDLRRARLPVDRKPFRPHLTLARCGERLTVEQVHADLAVLDGYQGPDWTLTHLHLVRSSPGPSPEHHTVARVPVG
jgi:2'-5' RNA ligase